MGREFQPDDVAWTGTIEFQAGWQAPYGEFGCMRTRKMMRDRRDRLVVRDGVGYPKRLGSIRGSNFNNRNRSAGHRRG